MLVESRIYYPKYYAKGSDGSHFISITTEMSQLIIIDKDDFNNKIISGRELIC